MEPLPPPRHWKAVFAAGLITAGAQALVVTMSAGELRAVSASVPVALGIVLLLPAVLRAVRRTTGRRRDGWALVLGGMLVTAPGFAVQAWLDAQGSTRVLSIADVAFLLSAVALLGAALALVPPPAPRTRDLRAVIDGALIIALIGVVAWSTAIDPLLSQSNLAAADKVTVLLVPLLDAVIVAAMLTRTSRARPRADQAGVAAAIIVIAITVVAIAVDDLGARAGEASPASAGYTVALSLFYLAAVHARDAIPAPDRRRPPTIGSVAVPTLAIVVGGAGAVLGRDEPFILADSVAIIALVGVRQVALLLENLRLTDRLSHTLDRLEQEERVLRHEATHDSLTGLANRSLFADRLTQAINRVGRSSHGVGIVYLDLDGFKGVNDTRGHETGDELLSTIGARIAGCTRVSDTAARVGGDEFAVILDDVADGAAVQELIDRLRQALAPLAMTHSGPVPIQASIGCTFSDDPESSLDQLMREADRSMYEVKRSGHRPLAAH